MRFAYTWCVCVYIDVNEPMKWCRYSHHWCQPTALVYNTVNNLTFHILHTLSFLSLVFSLILAIFPTHYCFSWLEFPFRTKCKLYEKRLKSCKIFILLKNQFPSLSFIWLSERERLHPIESEIVCVHVYDVYYECELWFMEQRHKPGQSNSVYLHWE